MADGISTKNLPLSSNPTELIGHNNDDATVRVSRQALARLIGHSIAEDLAVAGGVGIFDSVSAGENATEPGQYFTVSGSGDDYLILYRNVAGSAQEISRSPSVDAVQSVVLPAGVANNWNEISRTGFYRNTSASATGLPAQINNMTVMHIERGDGGADQVAYRHSESDPHVWRRVRVASTGEWGAWTEVLTEQTSPVTAPARPNNDWNETSRTGFYRNTSASAPGLPVQRNNMTLMHIERSDGGASQVAYRHSAEEPQTWRRHRSSTDGQWSDWSEFLTDRSGVLADMATSNNWDEIGRTGFYRNTQTDAVGIPSSNSDMTLIHIENASGGALQLASRHSEASPQTWRRHRYSSGDQWSDWSEFLTTGSETPSPLEIAVMTEADAAALSESERQAHDWYYLTDKAINKFTHRSDLPPHEPTQWAVSREIPGGNLDPSSSGVSEYPDVVTLRADGSLASSGSGRRVLFARLTGAEGRQPTIHVEKMGWPPPQTLSRHRLVWALDPDGDEWSFFDNEIDNDAEGRWEFSNDTPFASNVIYVANGPRWTPGRYEQRIAQWTAHPLTRPTPSAVIGYQIGTIPSRYLEEIGQLAPASVARAFAVGAGPRNVRLTSGVHPDEYPGHYIFEGAIETLLGDDSVGQALRGAFTFYCYPNLNAQGLWAGATRMDVEAREDANRVWTLGPDYQSAIPALYIPAWLADFGGSLAVSLDFHSWPARDPSDGAARSLWRTTDLPPEEVQPTDAYVQALQSYGDVAVVTTGTSTSVTASSRLLATPQLAVIAEYVHTRAHGPNEWRGYGRDVMRALADIVGEFA